MFSPVRPCRILATARTSRGGRSSGCIRILPPQLKTERTVCSRSYRQPACAMLDAYSGYGYGARSLLICVYTRVGDGRVRVGSTAPVAKPEGRFVVPIANE